MAKCAICEKAAHFGNNVSHSHRRSNKMWKSNVKSVKIKTAEQNFNVIDQAGVRHRAFGVEL